LLLMARDSGLETLEAACDLVLQGNVVAPSVVMNAMQRLIAPMQPVTMNVPDMQTRGRTAGRLRPLRPLAQGFPCHPLIIWPNSTRYIFTAWQPPGASCWPKGHGRQSSPSLGWTG
jgi:hypothetical protein